MCRGERLHTHSPDATLGPAKTLSHDYPAGQASAKPHMQAAAPASPGMTRACRSDRPLHLALPAAGGSCLAFTKMMPADRPTRMDARFSMLQGTLNATRPITATGILFRLPTSE